MNIRIRPKKPTLGDSIPNCQGCTDSISIKCNQTYSYLQVVRNMYEGILKNSEDRLRISFPDNGDGNISHFIGTRLFNLESCFHNCATTKCDPSKLHDHILYICVLLTELFNTPAYSSLSIINAFHEVQALPGNEQPKAFFEVLQRGGYLSDHMQTQ